jgi:hypothetical protein
MSWVDEEKVVYGFSSGTVVVACLVADGPLQEIILEDFNFLRGIWTGIVNSVAERRQSNESAAIIAAYPISTAHMERNPANISGYIFTVNSVGLIRLWNTSSKKVAFQSTFFQLLDGSAAPAQTSSKGDETPLLSGAFVSHLLCLLNDWLASWLT